MPSPFTWPLEEEKALVSIYIFKWECCCLGYYNKMLHSDGFNHRNIIPSSSGSQKSETKVWLSHCLWDICRESSLSFRCPCWWQPSWTFLGILWLAVVLFPSLPLLLCGLWLGLCLHMVSVCVCVSPSRLVPRMELGSIHKDPVCEWDPFHMFYGLRMRHVFWEDMLLVIIEYMLDRWVRVSSET